MQTTTKKIFIIPYPSRKFVSDCHPKKIKFNTVTLMVRNFEMHVHSTDKESSLLNCICNAVKI